jgi:DNA-directed RNA polymerase alpha subunit
MLSLADAPAPNQPTTYTMTDQSTPHWNKNDFTQDRENIYPITKINYKDRNLRLNPKIGRDKTTFSSKGNSALREENTLLISKNTNRKTPWEERSIKCFPPP